MSWLLNIIYSLCLLAISPWLLWRYLFQSKSRRGWSHKLLGRVPTRSHGVRCIWIHAVSVGEVNLLQPLITGLLDDDPATEIVISTSTETGFDLANNKYPQHSVFFCPMDFSWSVRETLRRIRPDLLILTELELWPNLILNTRAVGAKVMIANARLSESSYRGYRLVNFLIGPVLKSVNLIAAQNDKYANRFKMLGCENESVSTTGSIKFDNACFDRNTSGSTDLAKLLPAIRSFVFLAGSTQFEEDVLAVETYQHLVEEHPGLQLILVPRHPDRSARLARYLDDRKLHHVLRSNGQAQNTRGDGLRNPILIVDVIGELGAWWGTADVAYVGGSMGSRGGQNMIEPAAFGIPVSFGPHTENFRHIVQQLLDANAAVVVSDQKELEAFVSRALNDRKWAQIMGEKARQLVSEQQGATRRTLDCIQGLMTQPGINRKAA